MERVTMFVYAIVNHKGGVGKTTTAVNLGAALKEQGKRVLLIDLDPHASLTVSVGQAAGRYSMGDVLKDPAQISHALLPCAQGMALIPASATLAVVLAELAFIETSQFRLQQALQIVSP